MKPEKMPKLVTKRRLTLAQQLQIAGEFAPGPENLRCQRCKRYNLSPAPFALPMHSEEEPEVAVVVGSMDAMGGNAGELLRRYILAGIPALFIPAVRCSAVAKPNVKEIDLCSVFVQADIQRSGLTQVIACGQQAARSLLGKDMKTMKELVGRILQKLHYSLLVVADPAMAFVTQPESMSNCYYALAYHIRRFLHGAGKIFPAMPKVRRMK